MKLNSKTTFKKTYPRIRNTNSPRSLVAKISVAGLALSMMAGAHAQTIIQYTERALPGDPINIVGDGLTGTVNVFLEQIGPNGLPGRPISVPTSGQSTGVVQANVPSTFASGLWGLQVTTAAGQSNLVYINQAQVFSVDSEQASPGSSITIYGRNLQALGTTQVGYVKLVPSSGATLTATVQKAGPYSYTVQVPAAAVVGQSYQVVVSNGFGGTAGEVTAPSPLFIQAAGADPFGLGVWWGTQFTFANNVYNIKTDSRLSLHASGSGTTQDLAAIQAAIIRVSQSGGGVVYLPTGTYQIGGTTSLQFYPKVVLKGDGPGKTILNYGYNYTSSTAPNGVWAIRLSSSTLNGLYGLTINNLNSNRNWNQTILLSSTGSGQSDKVFINNCNIQLGNGYAIRGLSGTHMLLENSTVATTSVLDGPVDFTGSMYSAVQNNTMSYRNGRIRFPYASNDVIQNNTISRDNNYMTPGAVETGGIEVSSSRLTYIMNNTIAGIGPFPTQFGCGEMINSQRSNTPDEEDLGTVTGATSTTLTNSNANWTTSQPFSTPGYGLYNRAIVGIVKGKGAGQWRYITSNTPKTLSLSAPWTVIPDATSTYTIGFWSADRQLMVGNKISNSTIGISVFTGGWACVVDSNQLTNAGRIMLRADDALHDSEVVPGPMKGRRHSFGWDNWISNNTVTNTSGDMPAAISVYSVCVDGVSYGNLLLNTEVRSNSVAAHSPNTIHPDESGSLEGYWNMVVMWTYTTPDPYCTFGSILVNNTSKNLSTTYYTPGSGLTCVKTVAAAAIKF